MFRSPILLHHGPLLGAAVAGSLAAFLAWEATTPVNGGLIGWCIGALSYVGLSVYRMSRAGHDALREHAARSDVARGPTLWLSVAIGLASVVGVLVDLANVKVSLTPTADVAVAAFAIVISWLFIQIAFIQHYAHEFLMDRIGLVFPHTDTPNFWDFSYFTLAIGLTYQVSDVAASDTHFRKIIIGHALLSFTFNTVILALVVNFAAGLAS